MTADVRPAVAAAPRWLAGAPRWLAAALAMTVVVVVAALALRLGNAPADPMLLGGRLFPVLVAAALADVSALTRRRAPGVAWFAVVLSLALAVVEMVGALRDHGFLTDGASTATGLLAAVAGFVAAALVALANAVRPRRHPAAPIERFAVLAAAVAFLAVAVAAGWTLMSGLAPSAAARLGDAQLSPIRVTGRLALAAVAMGLAAGLLRDVRPSLERGWRRWRAGADAGGGRSLVETLADELLPWGAAAQSEAREAERARLAADLHAFVLPDLRRAAAAISGAGAPEPAVAGVQRALVDVEQLMHGRQSMVLEQFGLVAALEWLAERSQRGTALEVRLNLEGELVEERGAVRIDIARAAFRIAMLALDNVERHAGAANATIRLQVDPAVIALAISDDGQTRRRPATAEGRGVADMRSEALSTGGALRVLTEPSTTVEVTWPRR